MWHVHNSASSGGEVGGDLGWCGGTQRMGKVTGFLVVVLTGKDFKRTEEDKGRI